MVSNFGFLIEGKLAGSARPGYGSSLRDNLMWLHEQGIRAVLSLTIDPIPASELSEAGLQGLHLPVRDFAAPSPEQIRQAVEFIRRNIETGNPVLVHCGSGYGRTGSILACYLASNGNTAKQAISSVRSKRPGSIETPEQEEAIRAYARAIARDSRRRGNP
ncbi:MAG: hypothetical protein BWZ10_02079 [candidate division BRC1 bacterium ADurb.BinA364]|nr:MAG: hypothetical protein BWZ10_02079 [candidate division BRC1 bacterium ADurb.BinA364]